MSWTLLLGIVFVLGLALLIAASRRLELRRMKTAVETREKDASLGGAEARLSHPVVDLSRCLGCGTCVASCPEEGVLELVHGQAAVVRGARCRGHSACERECPVGAITVTIANLETREDVPVVDEELQAVGTEGLFLAGEVTGHTLIKTAIEHGTAVGAEIARRVHSVTETPPDDRLDLVVVGAGPAGLACALEAKRNGLAFVVIDQETSLGGTVAKYPRRKLVMSQPVELPMYGRFARTSYTKEELIDLWSGIVREQQLPVQGGVVLEGLERGPDGTFVVHTDAGDYRADNVCLALGRRGVPNRLGVPGEELPKVAYSLLDAHSYQGRRILVVGGGDSAVEAAHGPGGAGGQRGHARRTARTRSSASPRRTRGGSRPAWLDRTDVHVLFREPTSVRSRTGRRSSCPSRMATAACRTRCQNDDVFVMAGGTPPVDAARPGPASRSTRSCAPRRRRSSERGHGPD